jgi:alginate O-acetyltransferase complex protein AlgJ
MPTRGLLRNSPVFAVAGFIAFWFLATLWNFAIEPFYPKLKIRSADSSLSGMAKAEAIPMSLDAVWTGRTQKSLSSNFGRLLPPFPLAVRSKNQFLYSAFGAAGSSGLVVGRGDQLFQWDYIRDFCERGGPLDQKRIDQWADSIRDIQDRIEASGRAFAYVITPSKAAQYPQYLPEGLRCPPRADANSDKLRPFRAALDKRGIRYIDAARILRASKANYPIDLFPRGGTHWNMLGAALATQNIVKALDEGKRDLDLGAFAFNYRIESEAKSFDRDLLDLMNLLWPDAHYPVPAIDVVRSETKCPRAPHVVELGGSFLHEINILWENADCAPSVDHWFYFKRSDGFGTWRFDIPAADTSVGLGRERQSDLSDLPESVRQADIVLLEENESNISTMKQVGDLRNAAAALK